MKKTFIILFYFGISFQIFSQNTDVSTINVGEYRISMLCESRNNGNTNILLDTPEDTIKKYLPDGFTSSINVFLIQNQSQNILIDAGLGLKLDENLKSLNVKAEQIDIILITHVHGDHIGGLLKDNKKAFPNAKIYFSEKEISYWKSINNELFNNVISKYENNIMTFVPNNINGVTKEVIENIFPIESSGHTPGHCSFLLSSANEKLLFLGDITHVTDIQYLKPEVAVTYDVNPKQAVETRKIIFEYIYRNELKFAGAHILGGFGYLEAKNNEGYIFAQ